MRALLLILAFAAGPALAQQAPAPPLIPAPAAASVATPAADAVDPLDALLAPTGPKTTDEEAAETAAPTPAPPPPPRVVSTPVGTLPIAQAYDLRIKSSIAAAQGLQGPLDGGWSVIGPDGAPLLALQIVDRGAGDGVLEGAWRDVRKPGAVGSTGLIDSLDHADDTVVAIFSPPGAQNAQLTLRPLGGARWAGTLVEGGSSLAVTAEREAPPALPAGYAASGRGPVIWPSAYAPIRAAPPPAACATKGKKGKALKAAKAKCAKATKGGKAKAMKTKKGKAKATTSRKKRRR
ncbi:MAG: hypothetical protein JWP92_753 [Caulobacter sp.]|nr:hypothetical protein [Caulobacter sp.]